MGQTWAGAGRTEGQKNREKAEKEGEIHSASTGVDLLRRHALPAGDTAAQIERRLDGVSGPHGPLLYCITYSI